MGEIWVNTTSWSNSTVSTSHLWKKNSEKEKWCRPYSTNYSIMYVWKHDLTCGPNFSAQIFSFFKEYQIKKNCNNYCQVTNWFATKTLKQDYRVSVKRESYVWLWPSVTDSVSLQCTGLRCTVCVNLKVWCKGSKPQEWLECACMWITEFLCAS